VPEKVSLGAGTHKPRKESQTLRRKREVCGSSTVHIRRADFIRITCTTAKVSRRGATRTNNLHQKNCFEKKQKGRFRKTQRAGGRLVPEKDATSFNKQKENGGWGRTFRMEMFAGERSSTKKKTSKGSKKKKLHRIRYAGGLLPGAERNGSNMAGSIVWQMKKRVALGATELRHC